MAYKETVTIFVTIAETLLVNTENYESFKMQIVLPGKYDDNQQIYEAVSGIVSFDKLRVAQILSVKSGTHCLLTI